MNFRLILGSLVGRSPTRSAVPHTVLLRAASVLCLQVTDSQVFHVAPFKSKESDCIQLHSCSRDWSPK